MICPACHTVDKFVILVDISRVVDVYACVNCGCLRIATPKKPEKKDGNT